MSEKTAEQIRDEIVEFVKTNYNDKKYGFLIVVGEATIQEVVFEQKTNMNSIIVDYHLSALAKLGMHIHAAKGTIEDEREPPKEIIQ